MLLRIPGDCPHPGQDSGLRIVCVAFVAKSICSFFFFFVCVSFVRVLCGVCVCVCVLFVVFLTVGLRVLANSGFEH